MNSTIDRYARVVLLLAGAIGLAVLVIYTGLGSIAARVPHLAVLYAPDEPAAWYRPAAIAYAKRPGRLPEAFYRRAAQVAVRQPLAADPYVIMATGAIADGAGTRATRLLEEARRRDPRQRLARVLLIDQYIRANRLREAGIEIAAIARLTPETSPVLVDALAKLAVDPAASGALAIAIQGDPLIDALLARLVDRNTAPATILKLAEGWRPRADGGGGTWRTEFMQRLISTGDYREARAVWIRYGNGPRSSASAPFFNTGFSRSPALAPFNWRLTSNDVGVAEISKRHTLSVEYYGRQSGELVAQLTTFPPGEYNVSMVLEGATGGQGSNITFAIRCNDPRRDGRDLISVPLTAPTSSGRISMRFSVPGDCPAQWVTVNGVAGEFPTTQSVEIRDLSFSRGGDR